MCWLATCFSSSTYFKFLFRRTQSHDRGAHFLYHSIFFLIQFHSEVPISSQLPTQESEQISSRDSELKVHLR